MKDRTAIEDALLLRGSCDFDPIPVRVESGLWYQYYFQIERGRKELTAERHSVARVIWARNSPTWHFDEATFERAAMALDNSDYVDVVIHPIAIAAWFHIAARLQHAKQAASGLSTDEPGRRRRQRSSPRSNACTGGSGTARPRMRISLSSGAARSCTFSRTTKEDFLGFAPVSMQIEGMAELTLLKAQPDLHQLDGGDPPRGACEQSRPIACP